MMNNNFSNGANNNNNSINGGNVIMMNGRIETMDVFTTTIIEALKKVYTDADVTVNEVTKNNGLTLSGLTIKTQESNLAPTIYLNGMFEQHLNGMPMGTIINEIIKVYEQHRVHEDFDVRAITDYEAVRNKICFKLVNRERNEQLLSTVPYIEFNDLAVVFFIVLSSDSTGNATVTIKNDMLNIWGITDTKELFDIAKGNTQRMFHGCVHSMFDVLMDIVESNPDRVDSDIFDMNVFEDSVAPMFVATNTQKLQGSAVMLYDNLLETFAEKIGGSFFILPSSVHELIFVPCNGMDSDYLIEMVKSVNATEVSVDEFLSNHIYKFNSLTSSVEMI